MTPLLQHQLRHDVWATERLIELCRGVRPEQLELSVPGTYGSVRRTLAHIVGADENYIVRLLGEALHDDRLSLDATLDEIARHLAHVRDGIERIFATGEVDPEHLITDTPLRRPDQPRIEMYAWVPAAQFIHHGSDHRAQITATLSAHGIEPPDVQVWPYAMDLGATREAR